MWKHRVVAGVFVFVTCAALALGTYGNSTYGIGNYSGNAIVVPPAEETEDSGSGGGGGGCVTEECFNRVTCTGPECQDLEEELEPPSPPSEDFPVAEFRTTSGEVDPPTITATIREENEQDAPSAEEVIPLSFASIGYVVLGIGLFLFIWRKRKT